MALIKKDGKKTIAEPNSKDPIDVDASDFFSILAHSANAQKGTLVTEVLELVRKGDASATRLLEKALMASAPDDATKPIPILGGITQIKDKKLLDAIQAYFRTLQNSKPAQTA